MLLDRPNHKSSHKTRKLSSSGQSQSSIVHGQTSHRHSSDSLTMNPSLSRTASSSSSNKRESPPPFGGKLMSHNSNKDYQQVIFNTWVKTLSFMIS